MDFLYAALAVGFGLIVGSFINALSFRYHTGRGMGGRSRCMRCNAALNAGDLIPLLSHALLRGRCRHCGSSISLQYPAVEAVAGLCGYMAWILHPEPFAFSVATLVWATLLFVIIYDLRHTVLPTGALVLLGVLGLLSVFVDCVETCRVVAPSLLALAAGPILGSPLLFLSLVSRGRWMGWGDGMLAVGMGWLLGLSQGLSALLIAFWGGSIAGLSLVLLSRIRARKNAGYTMKSAIPFAPFLALGALIAHAYSLDILALPLW